MPAARSTVAAARPVDRFGLAALVASGTMAGHQLGYLTDGQAMGAHTYFTVVGPAVLLAALVAAWLAAARILRRDGGARPSLIALTTLQAGLFVAMEAVERAVGGEAFGPGWSAPVAVGLLAQPLVAWAALRLLGASARLLRRIAARPTVAARRSPPSWPAPAGALLPSVPRGVLRLRGPPVG